MPFRGRWFVRSIYFGLLTLVAELTGRSLTGSLDRALHVMPLAAPDAPAYPFLLASVRTLAAVLVAALAWRLVRAHATATAGERILHAVGGRSERAPRLRVKLSPRLWLLSFGATALWFLVQNDAERFSEGRWPLLGPWLHTYALPVFAVVAVALALGWSLVSDWVCEVEGYAAATFARAFRAVRPRSGRQRRRSATGEHAPRQLFGLAFESRPPPLRA